MRVEKIEHLSDTGRDPHLRGLEWTRRGDRPNCHGEEEKSPCDWSHRLPKEKNVKPFSGKFELPELFLEKTVQKNFLEGRYKEEPKNAIDGTEQPVRTAYNKRLHRNKVSIQVIFGSHPNKNITRQTQTEHQAGSIWQHQKENGSKNKSKVRTVESEIDDNDFECYHKYGGKPVHVDVAKEITQGYGKIRL